jgi:hypothetical protein
MTGRSNGGSSDLRLTETASTRLQRSTSDRTKNGPRDTCRLRVRCGAVLRLWNTTDVIGGPQATEMSEEYRRYRKLQIFININ